MGWQRRAGPHHTSFACARCSTLCAGYPQSCSTAADKCNVWLEKLKPYLTIAGVVVKLRGGSTALAAARLGNGVDSSGLSYQSAGSQIDGALKVLDAWASSEED